MKVALLFASWFILAFGMASCKKDSDPSGLSGTWQLTRVTDCYCAGDPNGPFDETLTFTDTSFFFSKGGRIERQGTYVLDVGAKCGTTELLAVLALTESGNPPTYKIPFAVDGQTLGREDIKK
ncbi:hypothetical protein [Hymenobacter sp. IS2118]|uniref:hypothetical protein n=1 Tax=Hymenobacter sp. IS2118 TaxID=1505605 RepID=UPI0005571FAE|nr:hypothetical protein [Hymenobacter sp. IS2118]